MGILPSLMTTAVAAAASVPDEAQAVIELAPPGAQVPLAFIGCVAWTGKTGESWCAGWRRREGRR